MKIPTHESEDMIDTYRKGKLEKDLVSDKD